ncbi:MAG: ferrichrome ABC transporter permease [Archangium sp.]|nr:ferrichrome ABC transporter permease [Archangium sp.]
MVRYGACVFLSAFLLFAIEPLIGKALLPWFGGSPAVWTTCVVFFQVLLLGGYTWAHQLQRLAPRRQVLVHTSVVLIALGVLVVTALAWRAPLLPSDDWRPADSTWPRWMTVRVLLVGVGAPFFVLSATGPLVQRWFTLAQPTASHWRLYALSNAGSLLALVTYPFVFEPLLTLRTQAWSWAAGFVVLGALLFLVSRGAAGDATVHAHEPSPSFPLPVWARWVALAALPSLLLLAITNHLCQEIAVVPFLWVLPLALYLVSLILCFEGTRWYRRALFVPLLGLLLVAAGGLLVTRAPVLPQILVWSAFLFVACMVCHGELAATRPEAAGLTSFSLALSLGGALGGLFVALVAPLVFDTFFELDLGLLAMGALTWGLLRERAWPGAGQALAARLGVNLLIFVLGGVIVAHTLSASIGALASTRSFFGTLRVLQDGHGPQGAKRTALLHGATVHGFQVANPAFADEPTAYFTRRSGVGLALEHHARRSSGAPLNVGVIGLGIGTLAAYSRASDDFRFYELSPDVARLAQDPAYFSYLSRAHGRVSVVLGDGRVSLERGAGQLDVLAMDAFGSDSVPVHLLTREAFAVYARQLRGPESVIAVNVLNRTLDLAPLVFRMADELGFEAVHVVARPATGDADPLELPSDWVLLSRDRVQLDRLSAMTTVVPRPPELPQPWTDDFSNLAALLKPLGR